MECIILAGGLGTRLQGVIGNYPKSMAPLNDKPFLHYVFQYLLQQQHVSRVVLSLGFKHEVVTEWLSAQQFPFVIDYVIEQEPLGTGGGISLALSKTTEENVAVLNGDTMFRVDINELFNFHKVKKACTTLALKPMHNFSRYGVVHVNADHCITRFEEKKQYDTGLINGGVYIINKQSLLVKKLPQKYSFEKDYLESFVHEHTFFGFESEAYFIDIGIPDDYATAQQDFNKIFHSSND